MIFFPGKLAEEVGEADFFFRENGGFHVEVVCFKWNDSYFGSVAPTRKRWMAKPPSLVGKGIPTRPSFLDLLSGK